MSKVAKAVCALAGAAVNGAVAAVSGGNPILVALSGGVTALVAEEAGEIVREDELVAMYQEKPDAFEKLVMEAGKKDAKKSDTKAQAVAAKEVVAMLPEVLVELRRHNTLTAASMKPQLEKIAAEEVEKATKAERAAKQKEEDETLAVLAPLLEKMPAYLARMVKAEKKAAANG